MERKYERRRDIERSGGQGEPGGADAEQGGACPAAGPDRRGGHRSGETIMQSR